MFFPELFGPQFFRILEIWNHAKIYERDLAIGLYNREVRLFFSLFDYICCTDFKTNP